MVRGSFVYWFVGIITWGSFVCYFNNVARVSVSSTVLNNLSTTIWESNAVFTIGRVTISGFVSSKVNTGIFINYGIFVLVFRWDISVGWFMVRRMGGLVRRSGLVNWSWFVDWCWMVYWCWFVGWGWVARGMRNSMTVSSGVSMFNCSMAANISIGSGQEGNKSDEGLEDK